MEESTRLHERVATLEANNVSMERSMKALADSISALTETVNGITTKIAMALGGFSVLMFLLTLVSSYITKH